MAVLKPLQMTLVSGRTMTIRSLDTSDVPAFLEFIARLPHESSNTMQYVGKRQPELDESKARIEKNRADHVTLDIGAFDGGKLIGFINFRMPNPDHPWQMHLGRFGMMVLKDYWGQGVGKKLLSVIEPHAMSAGIQKIEAEVRVANERGVNLYKSSGYKIEGKRQKAVMIDSEWGDEYSIAKFLGEASEPFRLPSLETSRLILRPLEISDAESIYAYAKNPSVSQYTLWEPHQSVKDSLSYIKNYAFRYYAEGNPEPFGMVLKTNPGRVIGTAGCFWVSKDAKSMELAYALDEAHWGKGITSEACQAVLDYCFKTFALKRIQSRCKRENKASARVMEKIGMTYEGTLKSSLFHRGRHWDMCHYAFVR